MAGVPGKSTPTPCRQLGVASVASRAVSSPCGAAGRTNPLTRPALEKPPQARAGLGMALLEWMGGQGSRSDRAAAPALTPRNDPTLRAGGWGCFSPSRLPRGERPRRAVGDDLAFEPLGFSNPRATASGARSEAPRVKLTGGELHLAPSRQQGRHGFPQETHLWRLTFGKGGCWGASAAPLGPYSLNMSRVSGSRSGASCGPCWPPSITPLIPAFAIRLRSRSSVAMWFLPLPRQPNSGLSL